MCSINIYEWHHFSFDYCIAPMKSPKGSKSKSGHLYIFCNLQWKDSKLQIGFFSSYKEMLQQIIYKTTFLLVNPNPSKGLANYFLNYTKRGFYLIINPLIDFIWTLLQHFWRKYKSWNFCYEAINSHCQKSEVMQPAYAPTQSGVAYIHINLLRVNQILKKSAHCYKIVVK
jgi:hypothetical protein